MLNLLSVIAEPVRVEPLPDYPGTVHGCVNLDSTWLIRLGNGPAAHMVEFLSHAKARSLHFPNSPGGRETEGSGASRTLSLAKTGTQKFHKSSFRDHFPADFDRALGDSSFGLVIRGGFDVYGHGAPARGNLDCELAPQGAGGIYKP